MPARSALAICMCLALSGCLSIFSSDESSAELRGALYADRLDPLTAAVRQGRITHFTCRSRGGGLYAWMRLAEAVAERRVSVDVPAGENCASGAALVVMAAATNGLAAIGNGARVSFHVPSSLPDSWGDHLALSGGRCYAVAHLAVGDAKGNSDLAKTLRRYRMPEDLVRRVMTETAVCTYITLTPDDWARMGVEVGKRGG